MQILKIWNLPYFILFSKIGSVNEINTHIQDQFECQRCLEISIIGLQMIKMVVFLSREKNILGVHFCRNYLCNHFSCLKFYYTSRLLSNYPIGQCLVWDELNDINNWESITNWFLPLWGWCWHCYIFRDNHVLYMTQWHSLTIDTLWTQTSLTPIIYL